MPTLAQAFSEFPMLVRYTVLPHGKDLPPPAYQSQHAAGLDLRAAVDKEHGMSILPGEWAAVPTGLCLSIPKGYEGQVRPRSGLAMNYAVTVLNSPGTIDADYRGEIKVILINHNPDLPFRIERGLRIAQIVFSPVQTVTLQAAVELDETKRGEGGFGSTGTAKEPFFTIGGRKDGKYDLIGIDHMRNGQSAGYLVGATKEECFKEALKRQPTWGIVVKEFVDLQE